MHSAPLIWLHVAPSPQVKSDSEVAQSCPTLCNPTDQAPLPMGFSRQEHWGGLQFPHPGIFSTQGSNLGLPHCRQTLYLLSHQGSPGWLHGWCLKIQLQSQPLPHSTQQVSESSPQQALHSSSCRKHSHTRRGAPIFFLSILPKHLLGHEQKL